MTIIKFTLIIPVFQTASILQLFINSLSETLSYYSQIIFINDGSGANISSMLNSFKHSNHSNADITIIEHLQSKGCAASINEAIKIIDPSCDYVVFLDSDLILQKNWQDMIVDDFCDNKVGIVGGMLLYPQTGGVQCCGITFQNATGYHLHLNARPVDVEQLGKFEIQTTVFAFCAIRYDAIRATGYLDESYFNGYEDWDYQFRVRSNGFTAITDTRIQHFHWEKSNGIHRNYNRKSNLGRFWLKHSSEVQDDLCHFIKNGLKQHDICENNIYNLIDLCESRSISQVLRSFLLSDEGIQINEKDTLASFCDKHQTIWLPEIMNSHAFKKQTPYLFLCDHYIRLLDNKYWWMLRHHYNSHDLIIDTYGNVLLFSTLQDSFWPGTKIR
ncbi:glycosyltransferase family 2 protein [Lacrimispora sp.]|uniref:glycosyltransferase family 2 protein n=1 Tax=Lacrimispora sp. TaxID=2719234 RepID=UPI00345FAB55